MASFRPIRLTVNGVPLRAAYEACASSHDAVDRHRRHADAVRLSNICSITCRTTISKTALLSPARQLPGDASPPAFIEEKDLYCDGRASRASTRYRFNRVDRIGTSSVSTNRAVHAL